MSSEPGSRPEKRWSPRRVLAVQLAVVLVIPLILGGLLGWYGLNSPTAEDLSPVGSESHELLDSFPDSSLIIEFAYQSSIGPPPSTSVSTLLDRVNETCQKSSVSVVEHVFASSESSFSTSDLWSLELSARQSWPEIGTMSLFYLYLAGGYRDDSSVIGLAYHGSSIAVFGGAIAAAAGGQTDAVTTTVLVHEFGHELGLVGIVGSAPNEDPAHPYHSSDPNDVMYWSVDTTAFLSGLLGGHGPSNQFDAADLSDLATVRSTPIAQELFPWAALTLCLAVAGVIVILYLRKRKRRATGGPTVGKSE
ncbi:MAG TPA: hypothetical protein VGU43_04795 [Thermoplasmata archaeon]|nr:hypothetical protein [Thermoplasmata archaeon]